MTMTAYRPNSRCGNDLRIGNQSLCPKGHLAAKNFIIRLLYKDTY